MTVLDAVIQGVLQGLTEFLPVSSSGHLALFQYFTGQNESAGIMFSILLHMGTLLAVLLAFHKTIIALVVEFIAMIRDLVRTRLKRDAVKEMFASLNPTRRMILLLIVSLLPMGLSLFMLDYLELVSNDNDIIFEGCCFLITSILLFLADHCVKGHKDADNMKYRDAIAVGTMQAFATFPGISRSGSTISVGLMAGLNREFAVAFSFIMGIPPVLGANIMEFSKMSEEGSAPVPASMILIGMAVALVSGLLAIRMVGWLVNSEKFKLFAWYTLTLGVLVIGIGIFETLTGHMLQEFFMSFRDYAFEEAVF